MILGKLYFRISAKPRMRPIDVSSMRGIDGGEGRATKEHIRSKSRLCRQEIKSNACRRTRPHFAPPMPVSCPCCISEKSPVLLSYDNTHTLARTPAHRPPGRRRRYGHHDLQPGRSV